MTNLQKQREINAGVLRRCLNGFFETNFSKDGSNLEALEHAIAVEKLILDSGYYIDYYITGKGKQKKINRAKEIIDNPRNQRKQKITIKEWYGDKLEQLPKKEFNAPFKKGLLVFNVNKGEVGFAYGYNLNNTKDKMRYNVVYAKLTFTNTSETSAIGNYEASTTAWNEDLCVAFDPDNGNTFDQLYEYLEITSLEDVRNGYADMLQIRYRNALNSDLYREKVLS